MKFLFIVQGEGRGHLTQAIALQEILHKNGHEVVKMLVGKSQSQELPDFFKKKAGDSLECFESPHFTSTLSKKRINLGKSIFKNICRIPAYFRSIRFIKKKIEESQADRVINFYELLTGLTYLFRTPSVPQICIGHQYLFLHSDFQFPPQKGFQLFLLKLFTQITCLESLECLALSFRQMENDSLHGIRVMPPLLRKQVKQIQVTNQSYIHGYMVNEGFADTIYSWHQKNPEVPLHFFWDKKGKPAVEEIDASLSFHRLDDKSFLQSMAGCAGFATTAGFESVCEAMYLGKPLLMVPAHIEQDCNAFDAALQGAGIINSNFDLNQLIDFSETYEPVSGFIEWANQAEFSFLKELEKEKTFAFPNYLDSQEPRLLPA